MTTHDDTLDRLFDKIIAIENEPMPTTSYEARIQMDRIRFFRREIDKMLFGAYVERPAKVTYSGDKPKPKPQPKPAAMPRTLIDTPKPNKPELNAAIRLQNLIDTTLPEYDDHEDTWFVDARYLEQKRFEENVRYHYTDLGKAMAAVLQTNGQKQGSAA